MGESDPSPRWAHRLGRFATAIHGWGLLLFPIAALAAALVTVLPAVMVDAHCSNLTYDLRTSPIRTYQEGFADTRSLRLACTQDHLLWALVGPVLGGALQLPAFWLFSGAFAGRAQRARAADARILLAPRLVAYRDWYLRGDLTEEEFKRLDEAAGALASGRHPSDLAHAGASTATLATTLVVPLGLGALVAVVISIAVLPDPFNASDALLWLAVTGSLLVWYVAYCAWAWTTGRRTRKETAEAHRAAYETLEAKERRVLGAANLRARGGRTSVRPSTEAGPSFQAYAASPRAAASRP